MGRRYEWSRLNHLQLGRYAEYFVKMEFTMFGWQVYQTEVDDRGIDFVVRAEGGRFLTVQVKSVRGMNYIFLQKEKFRLSKELLAAVVLFHEGLPPQLYLIPSLMWKQPNALLCDRDYVGGTSKPEYGLNLSACNQPLLDNFSFDRMIESLAPAPPITA